MTKLSRRARLLAGALLTCLAACDDSEPSETSASSASTTPPMGALQLEQWLAEGAYKAWPCEPAVHAARRPSPHGFNRICSNDLIADNVAGTGDWPRGAAAVKELHASADSTEPIGYAVYLKTADDSAGGANWYWYESVPAGVVADGLGGSGAAKAICVSCHVAAGADEAHIPSAGARDQVYTPVR